MGLISGLLEKTEDRSYPPSWWVSAMGYGGKTAAGSAVTTGNAITFSPFFAAVDLIARGIAQLPLPVYMRSGDARERAPAHGVYGLVHTRPNPEQTAYVFRHTVTSWTLIWGNGYAEIERNGASRPVAIRPIPSDIVKVGRDSDDSLIYKVREGTNEEKTIAAPDMLHVRGLGDNLVGYSPVTLFRESIGLGLAAEKFGAAFFGNDARPGGVLEHPGKLSAEGAKNLLDSWRASHGGAGNAHNPALLQEGMKWTSIGMPLEDAQFLETRKFQVTDIARIFHIPPHKLGDLDRATFCLPAGEMVFTETGPRPIESIRAGDFVWSRQGKELALCPVERAGLTGNDEILTIRTTNRTIRCNAKHPILCRRPMFEPRVDGRNIGGAYVQGALCTKRWVTEYVQAGKLVVGDTIVALDRLPAGGSLDVCPTRVPSIGFMEFCGLLLGDGNVLQGSGCVTISRAGNAAYMDHYRRVMAAEFHKVNGSPIYLQEGERQTRFSSRRAVRELLEIGFGGTSHTKSVPGWVFQLPESHRLAILRGYLDSDGSCDKRGKLAFHSVSESLLHGMRHLCISCGVPVRNMRLQCGVTTLPNGERADVRIWTFTCSDPAANLRIGSHTPLYLERMAAGKPFGRKARKYPRFGGRAFGNAHFGLSRISGIARGPAEPVYDLAVAGGHSFIAGGVVVHNSNIEHQAIEWVQDCLGPWLVAWEQELNWKLFSKSERGTFFTEFLVDGLLRGDIQSRYQAYAIGRNNGWLSANDIRQKENMNPLPGDQGDIYLVPANMKPADQVGKEPQPAPAPAEEPADTEDDQDDDRARVIDSHRSLLLNLCGRVNHKETNAMRRAMARGEKFDEAADKFYGAHAAHICEVAAPALHAFAAAMGTTLDEAALCQCATDIIKEHRYNLTIPRLREGVLTDLERGGAASLAERLIKVVI